MQLAKILSASALFTALAAGAVTAPVSTTITWDDSNPTNKILLTWEAIPTKLYNVWTTPALGQPWQPLTNGSVLASNNLVRFRTQADTTARFYRIAKVDTDPPEIWRLAPTDGAIAIERQAPLRVWLQDETGVDTNSITLTVGTNPPVTLADGRLAYAGGLLTYTPTTNQFLGAEGQFITNRLVVADTLGHWATNIWSFKLELAPVLAGNVVIVSPSSPFTLLSTNGDTYVFSYTTATSGLTNGNIVVSTDSEFPYKRLVLSMVDDPANHLVSLVTTQASLADILVQGTVRFYGGDFVPDPTPGPQPKSLDTTFGPITMYENASGNNNIKVEVLSGRLFFDPDFNIAAEFFGSRSLDVDISASMAFDLTMRGTWSGSWDFDADRAVGKPLRKFRLLGCIPIPILPYCIPIWAEAVWQFYLGTEGEVAGAASATAGFASSRSLAFGAHYRDGAWTTYANDTPSATPYPPAWQGNGSARIRGYVEPKLTIYLESLVGPSADLRPYVELEGKACVEPGQVGVDLALYAGLNGNLAGECRVWDDDWGDLPSWELFNVRKQLWHKNLAAGSGAPPVQTTPNMVWIPCGTFTMGSPASEPASYSDERPQTHVTLSQGFWLGKYEVTQGEYLSVMGSNPSYFTGDLSRPVERVSWDDAVAYCAALTQRERAAGRLPTGYEYRLPTEAQWEYACRAGTTTAFHYGGALRSGMANFYGYYEYLPSDPYHSNPSGIFLVRTTTVGSYAPNAWGLHDMHGNVWEWCLDWYGAYPGGDVTDPAGASSGSARVLRGGDWRNRASSCRSANRDRIYPDYRGNFLGFRLALVSVP
ncbi:MAG TPA: formylglycine-generating enzyme family protein [Verrucomicrobiota bacterium]|jgi:formylglycine-generating enzyme required for sulfatase activity|nr:formylglycine-generating enzyme family protein [Verrucomicrobiota bacterium]HQL79514.1 formylglycine-generating enzyme family protein [Verrucomicrobiota bacterium]